MHEEILNYFGGNCVLKLSASILFPTSHLPTPQRGLEPSLLFELIHFQFADSLFQCYSHTQGLINHLHKSYKSYFLLINISPGKLHRVALIIFQNNLSSYLEINNLALVS